jgi:hypothetical protein
MDFTILELAGSITPEALVQLKIDEESGILQETLIVGSTFMERTLNELMHDLQKSHSVILTHSDLEDLLDKASTIASAETSTWFKSKFKLPALTTQVSFMPIEETMHAGLIKVTVQLEHPSEHFYLN